MSIWLQVLLTIGGLCLPAGVVIGFWAWVRGKLTVMTGQVATLMAWKTSVEQRCSERREEMLGISNKIGEVHQRIDDLVSCIADKDSKTAKAVGILEGKVDSLLDR